MIVFQIIILMLGLAILAYNGYTALFKSYFHLEPILISQFFIFIPLLSPLFWKNTLLELGYSLSQVGKPRFSRAIYEDTLDAATPKLGRAAIYTRGLK